MKEKLMTKINEQKELLILKTSQFEVAKKVIQESKNVSELVANFFACIDFEIFSFESKQNLLKLLVIRFRALIAESKQELSKLLLESHENLIN